MKEYKIRLDFLEQAEKLEKAIDEEIADKLPEDIGNFKPELSFFGGIEGRLSIEGIWRNKGDERKSRELWYKIAKKLQEKGVKYFTPSINDLIKEFETNPLENVRPDNHPKKVGQPEWGNVGMGTPKDEFGEEK